jgi:hypothetical protein
MNMYYVQIKRLFMSTLSISTEKRRVRGSKCRVMVEEL